MLSVKSLPAQLLPYNSAFQPHIDIFKEESKRHLSHACNAIVCSASLDLLREKSGGKIGKRWGERQVHWKHRLGLCLGDVANWLVH